MKKIPKKKHRQYGVYEDVVARAVDPLKVTKQVTLFEEAED